MKANQAYYPVQAMCRVLKVSAPGYYRWLQRPACPRAQQDARLRPLIKAIHQRSHGCYGAPRIRTELLEGEWRVAKKRVARLMKEQGLCGIKRAGFVVTTQSEALVAPAVDLVQRQFRAERADALWVADFTYVPTWQGFVYLAIVLDVYSRRIVGWSMRDDMTARLVVEALEMALQQRRPRAVIHHCDHGRQYTSGSFAALCERWGVNLSMGSIGDAYDNAMAESFFATLKCEWVNRQHYATRAQAMSSIFQYIEGWYNPQRRHSALGYLSPINYERRMAA